MIFLEFRGVFSALVKPVSADSLRSVVVRFKEGKDSELLILNLKEILKIQESHFYKCNLNIKQLDTASKALIKAIEDVSLGKVLLSKFVFWGHEFAHHWRRTNVICPRNIEPLSCELARAPIRWLDKQKTIRCAICPSP